jgi:beta-glucosidase
LGIITTCKVNLYLNDSLIANTSYHFRDEFNDPRLRKSNSLRLEAGKKYRLRVEAGESYGDARVQLVWGRQRVNTREELKQEALATARQADAIVLCMGLSSRLEGEEMDVNIEGFKGGDRTNLDLPKVQEELIREIAALGKPVVLVLLNGSALAINWEGQHIPAILEAWYPGQAAGQAIADVLFGDYNPAGRLPVTFYTGLKDLPSFGDYTMAGRTYRYFKGEVLYPFGYGLSYTRFQYDHLQIGKTARRGDTVRVSVNVKNTGAMEGDEVAQLYVSDKNATVPVPIRSLRGFKRIHLRPGEEKTLYFAIAPDAFTVIDDKMQKVTLPGRFDIAVGGGQPDGAGNGQPSGAGNGQPSGASSGKPGAGRPQTSNTVSGSVTMP